MPEHASGNIGTGIAGWLLDSTGAILLLAPGVLGLVTTGWLRLAVAPVPSPPPYPPPCLSPPSYVMPSCESDARAKSAEVDDPFKDRELPGGRRACPLLVPSPLSVLPTPVVQKQLPPLALLPLL